MDASKPPPHLPPASQPLPPVDDEDVAMADVPHEQGPQQVLPPPPAPVQQPILPPPAVVQQPPVLEAARQPQLPVVPVPAAMVQPPLPVPVPAPPVQEAPAQETSSEALMRPPFGVPEAVVAAPVSSVDLPPNTCLPEAAMPSEPVMPTPPAVSAPAASEPVMPFGRMTASTSLPISSQNDPKPSVVAKAEIDFGKGSPDTAESMDVEIEAQSNGVATENPPPDIRPPDMAAVQQPPDATVLSAPVLPVGPNKLPLQDLPTNSPSPPPVPPAQEMPPSQPSAPQPLPEPTQNVPLPRPRQPAPRLPITSAFPKIPPHPEELPRFGGPAAPRRLGMGVNPEEERGGLPPGPPGPPSQLLGPPQQQQQQQQRPPQPAQAFRGPPNGPPVPPGPGPPGPLQGGPPRPPPMRELRVEDALVYLDDVKREFGDRPRIYNEFLEIMKNFKSQEVDTPGVINRVSRLFRGYNNLILGFNKFLPDGYKISLQDLQRQDAEYARQQQLSQQQQQQQAQQPRSGFFRPQGAQAAGPGQPGGQRDGLNPQGLRPGVQPSSIPPQAGFGKKAPPGPAGPPMRPGQQLPHKLNNDPPAQPGAPHRNAAGQPNPPGMQRQSQQQQAQQQPQQQHQPVEFDHAISYVTNIKKRFADDPNTYHQFLEILHTYQKEQRGIKEVLEQVASLFADHPDLLKEFTFFLPDAVQDQARERLHRAAADSEARQALAAQQRLEQSSFSGGRTPGWAGPRGLKERRLDSQKFIDMTSAQQLDSATAGETEAQTGRQPQSGRKRPFSPGRDPQAHRPETFVYNSAVERQFFEAAKESVVSFSRDGGQAWAEFLKCLDMYAQDLLSKPEMLSFVEPLLGKRNKELFEEFKRILIGAGSPCGPTPSMEDSWYSVPLSEIDFFRCKQCTPSYRALPRDYPAPPCSDRSDEEKKILNDIWVSLPKGSEESYTFRHMRRNHCEEVLFRCEDERFEIDMCIDSNSATLRRLEPIAEEIAHLSHEETLISEISTGGGKIPPGEAGMGGLRFQYTFDPAILGVIHRNSITRIYGDSGQEMLELMVKNPSVSVPVVVQRLRQKDREWRSARDKLNRHWKELAEMNYYKSLDHRSLTWRTIDKRATSTRTLIVEIKDRAANGGREGEASYSARKDKAKEEHGSFFEVTMGKTFSQDLDLTNLPKPHKPLFTPHMSFIYENNSWAQQDAYRILSFALERGSMSPTDKERCHRLWRELFGPMFDLPLSWMQKPAVSYQESSSKSAQPSRVSAYTTLNHGEDNSHDGEDSHDDELGQNIVTEELGDHTNTQQKDANLSDHHPLPAGVSVSTIYGEGQIVGFRRSDMCYEIMLPFGTAFLRPEAVMSSVQRVPPSAYTNQLREGDRSKLDRKEDFLCFGTQSLYLFFRLHQILIHRLSIAKKMAYKVVEDQSLATLVEQMEAEPNEDMGRRRYEAYLSLVYNLVDGGHQSDAGGKYEDRARCLLGHGGFELATMDKLLSHILKNLQAIAHDDIMLNLVTLFQRHLQAGFKPEAFKQEAAYLSEGETMFCFQVSRVHDSDNKIIFMEHLGVIYEADEDSNSPVEADADPPPKRQRK